MKETHPMLRTERLTLRAFTLDDAPDVQRLCGDKEVARTMRPIPHPYPEGEAERWISTHRAQFEAGEAVHFAVELRSTGEFIGGVTLAFTRSDDRGHLAYWIGVPYWGRLRNRGLPGGRPPRLRGPRTLPRSRGSLWE